jgi:hypothetical protein
MLQWDYCSSEIQHKLVKVDVKNEYTRFVTNPVAGEQRNGELSDGAIESACVHSISASPYHQSAVEYKRAVDFSVIVRIL